MINMKKGFVYFRYILSAIFAVLIIAAAAIPNVSFTLDRELKQSRSLIALGADAWRQCREYIANEQAVTAVPAIQSFALGTMVGIAVAVVIAVVSLGLSLWSSVAALQIIRESDRNLTAQKRLTLCRVLPNEWWMLAVNLFAVVPAMFPYYLSAMYTHVLHLNTQVQSGLTVISVVLAVILSVATVISRRLEMELGVYPFDIK